MYLKSKSHKNRLYSVIQSKFPFHKDWVVTCENRATGDLFREEVHESRGRLQDTKTVTPESGRGRSRAIFKTFGLETFFGVGRRGGGARLKDWKGGANPKLTNETIRDRLSSVYVLHLSNWGNSHIEAALTFVANRREQSVSCSDSSFGEIFTNIKL